MADGLLAETGKHLGLFGDHHLVGGAGLHLTTFSRLKPIHRSASDFHFAASCESRLSWFGGLGTALAICPTRIEHFSIVLDSVGLRLSPFEFLTGSSLETHWLWRTPADHGLRGSHLLFLALRPLLCHLHFL
jgi:hypothetical protein